MQPRLRDQIGRILRVTSFRLTLLYAGIFILSVTLLFGSVWWSIRGIDTAQTNADLQDEFAEIFDAGHSHAAGALRQTVATFTRQSPDMHYILQDGGGHMLAGDMWPVAPVTGARLLAWPNSDVMVRGRGLAIEGGYLFVGVDDTLTRRLDRALSGTLLTGLAALTLLALGGGAAFANGVLRRVETINTAARAIMDGDLSRRIPLKGANDEFDQLGGVLNAMLDRNQRLMSGLQQVSTDIAHDLRTPLARMRERMELAVEQQTTVAGLRDALAASVADADGILATFSALLRIAQVQAGGRRAGFVRLDCAAVLHTLLEAYQPVAEEAGDVLIDAIGPCQPIAGDRALLEQCFANLIENAVRHAGPGSRITIGACSEGEHTTAFVCDNGPGIAPQHRAAVLTRFFRLEASRTTPGNGLGLAMVEAIAHVHEASLNLEDNGPGLKVTLRFLATP